MPRPPRVTEPGVVYHLLNRRVMRLVMFKKDADYDAFQHMLAASLERPDTPALLAYCFMPNHWHLVVQAGRGTDLSTWMQWLTVTHAHRWHAHYDVIGEGPLYQGRFKSCPIQQDVHFLAVCRYVEANALRAGLVRRAQDWPWGSLWCRRNRRAELHDWLKPWPVDRPRNWLAGVNQPMEEETLRRVRCSVVRGMPLGTARWQARIAGRLGLGATMRPRGRPCKGPKKSS